jgi:signal recognition particle subunit SRP54
VDDRDLDRIMAIIRSMTPGERADPKVLNASRKARVARGSGVTVTEVNQLLDRFEEARKMIKQIPGMAGLGGGGKAKRAQKKVKQGKGASRKGNPAARAAAQSAQSAQPGGTGRNGAPDNPFGLPAGPDGMPDLSQLKLPPGGMPGLGGPGMPKGPAQRGRQR